MIETITLELLLSPLNIKSASTNSSTWTEQEETKN